MAEVREVLFYYELGVFVAAWVLGWLCVWAVSRHTPKFLEAYARMILWNNVVDLCFSLVSAVLMCSVDVSAGLLYIVINNPYHPVSAAWGGTSGAIWAFALYLTVIAVPLQFIYRYGLICRSRPYTRREIMAMCAVALAYIAVHAILCPITMHPRSPTYDAILQKNPVYRNSMPNAYLAEDARNSLISKLHILNCQLILLVCYALTIVYGIRIMLGLRRSQQALSEERQHMQEHISTVMILQAIYPVVALALPLFIMALVPFLTDNLDVHLVGVLGSSTVKLIPVLNSLSVLLVMPEYRKAVFGC